METLSIILYVLGSILMVVLIILVVNLIGTVDKINEMADNINKKVNSLNGLFSVIDYTTNKLSSVSTRTVDAVVSLFNKIFKRERDEEE